MRLVYRDLPTVQVLLLTLFSSWLHGHLPFIAMKEKKSHRSIYFENLLHTFKKLNHLMIRPSSPKTRKMSLNIAG